MSDFVKMYIRLQVSIHSLEEVYHFAEAAKLEEADLKSLDDAHAALVEIDAKYYERFKKEFPQTERDIKMTRLRLKNQNSPNS